MMAIFFFIFCLIKGSLCEQWSVSLPQTVDALSGSCIKIPCRFDFPSDWDPYLDDSCRAIWSRGYWNRRQVFDSSLTGEFAKLNILQGNLTGLLREKDCTTILHDLPSEHYEEYFFRLECKNLKNSFPTSVYVIVQDSLPRPKIIPSRLEVEEGTPVRMKCSAAAPCPILPPTLTWTPSVGHTEESAETKSVASVINFTASYLHDKQKLSCTALYNRQSGHNDLKFENSLVVRVLHAPVNTSVSFSGPAREGDLLILTCNTNAHPAVRNYMWHKLSGDQVTMVSTGKIFYITVSEKDTHFYCSVSNRYGAQNSSVVELDVQFSPRETTVMVDPPGPVLEGSSVTLLCSSRANPAVTNYTWYRRGEEALASGPTLVIDGVELSHSGGYYCEVKNDLGEDISATFLLDVQYPPKNTSATAVQPGPVLGGSLVTLICTSMANPEARNFSWYRVHGQHTEVVGSQKYFSFFATKLSKDQYYCEALNVHGAECSQPASINVTFAPEILPSSDCIKGSTEIRCSCDTHGNPPPSLHWELAGQSVNHSADIQISVVPLEQMGIRSLIVFHSQDVNVLSLVCFSTNSMGATRFVFNVTAFQSAHGNHITFVLIGSAVGALGMLLLCVLLMLFIFRKKKANPSPGKGMVDTSDCLVADGATTSQEAIYANRDVLVQEGGSDEDCLHYANVSFAKLQAESEETFGEVRGLDSKTAEYAEIHLRIRAGSESNTKAGETVEHTDAGQEEDIEVQGCRVSGEVTAQPQEERADCSSETGL